MKQRIISFLFGSEIEIMKQDIRILKKKVFVITRPNKFSVNQKIILSRKRLLSIRGDETELEFIVTEVQLQEANDSYRWRYKVFGDSHTREMDEIELESAILKP